MIFSKQNMETALAYTAIYFDKIILINFVTNSFLPIKINDKEWDETPKKMKFTEWVKNFTNSSSYEFMECEDTQIYLEDLANQDFLYNLTRPVVTMYKKKINNEFHVVQTELYPIGSGLGYLFVKDISMMMKE